MRIPRDVSGQDLERALSRLGYTRVRQTGSHTRLTIPRGGEHHLTIPMHNPIKVGTLNGILREVAEHTGMTRDEVIEALFS